MTPYKAKLRERLERAHAGWHNTKDDQEGRNQRRAALVEAIAAIHEWALAEGDIPPEHLKLFPILGANLWSLNEGIQSDLLKPAPRLKPGRTPLPLERAVRLGFACAIVEVLSNGQGVAETERVVARAIGMEPGAFQSWRKAFNVGKGSKAKGKGPEASRAYHRALIELRGQPNPQESARELLRQLIGPGH
jgi:hypothetical protein